MAKHVRAKQHILPRERTAAFSGYRASRFAELFPHLRSQYITSVLRQRASLVVRYLYTLHGYRNFIQGMQSGLDLCAALALAELKATLPRLELYGAVPHPRFMPEQGWREIYRDISSECSEVYYTSPTPTKFSYIERNIFMVENASALVCYYDGAGRGTTSTYNYATEKGLPVYNLCNTARGLRYGTHHPAQFSEIIYDLGEAGIPLGLIQEAIWDRRI